LYPKALLKNLRTTAKTTSREPDQTLWKITHGGGTKVRKQAKIQ
jgi:hypothetical protein